MSRIDDELRTRLLDLPAVDLDFAGDLAKVRGAAARRALRHRLAGAALAVGVLGALVVGLAIERRSDDALVASQPRGSTPSAPTTIPPTQTAQAGDVAGATSTLIMSTNGNGGGVTISGLGDGATKAVEFPAESHPWLRGAVTDAVITPAGQLIIWNAAIPTTVYDATGRPDEPSPLTEAGALSAPGRSIGAITGDRQVVPTTTGSHVWIRGGSADLRLEYVNVATGEIQYSGTVPRQGSTGNPLIGTVGNDVLLQRDDDGSLLRVAPSGVQSVVAPPEPGANFVVMTDQNSVWISGDRQRLLIVKPDDTYEAIRSPASDLVWAAAGQPTIPSNSPDLAMLDNDGARLLVRLVPPESIAGSVPYDVEATTKLVVVDLKLPGVASFLPPANIITAFWGGDTTTFYFVERTRTGMQALHAYRYTTSSTELIDAAIPPGYYLIAAR